MDLIALGCHALNLGCRDVKSLLFIEFLMLFSMLAWDLGLWDFWNLDFGLSCFENDAILVVLELFLSKGLQTMSSVIKTSFVFAIGRRQTQVYRVVRGKKGGAHGPRACATSCDTFCIFDGPSRGP